MSDQKTTDIEETHVQFSTDVGYLDKFLEALEAYREEGILVFNEDAIYSKVADPAKVAMCISRIQGQALNQLEVNNADQLQAGLKFEKIRDCLSGTSNSSEVQVTWPVSSGSAKMIRLDVIDEDIQFELTTLNPENVPNMPENDPIKHSTRVVVSGNDLKSALKHAGKMVGADDSSITLETYDKTFQIRSSDQVEGRFSKQFHQSGPTDGDGLGEHQTEISFDYLDDISTVVGRGSEVTVHMRGNYPVRLDIDLDDNGDAQVIYIVAPRVDS